jgi:hypothetical protein
VRSIVRVRAHGHQPRIGPGSSWENAVEEAFDSLIEAKGAIEVLRKTYNTPRSNSSIGRKAPAAYTASLSWMSRSARYISSTVLLGSLLALAALSGTTRSAAAESGSADLARTQEVQVPFSLRASGRIRAHLTKASFVAAEARKVKLVYSFAPASRHFSYQLLMNTGAKWVKLRAVARTGRFAGSNTKTLKAIFGSRFVAAGRYRLELSADANRVRLAFEVVSIASLPTKPAKTVKLIFIHHSTGENWLADGNGNLGIALKKNNYFVSDTNYGWGPDGIGDRTDTGQWWLWFRGSSSSTYMHALYNEFGQHSSYTRLSNDPDTSRENEIIMFKSCFPNSAISGKPSDAAKTGSNPLRGQGAGSSMTVANVKGIYNDILPYFAAHQDKLFVLVVTPPLAQNATDTTQAANARAVANWLINEWLVNYQHKNVAVFDFYNVLTSNGGSPDKNDLGESSGNHHRWWNGHVQNSQTVSSNFLAYPTGDSHPSSAGNRKATGEFVPLLNYYYQRWVDSTN